MPHRSLSDYLFPLVLMVFLTLYVTGLAAGTEPEMALVRAAAGGLLMAVLARVARGIVDAAPTPAPAVAGPDKRGQHVDIAIEDDAPPADEPTA
jgi:hypothetical protein